jgi:hypothetical protein
MVPQREAARFCGRSPTGTDFITLREHSPGPLLFALRFRNIGTMDPLADPADRYGRRLMIV